MLEFWFSPKGRAARADYWYWLVLPFAAIAMLIVFIGPPTLGPQSANALLLGVFAVFCVSHMAIAIKRLHDQSLSGWFDTALILPFAAFGGYLAQPNLIDFSALERAPDEMRLMLLALFAAIFAPFAYVLGLIWFVMGKDGINRYGKDPLFR